MIKHWQTRSALGFVREYFGFLQAFFLSQWYIPIIYYLNKKLHKLEWLAFMIIEILKYKLQ